MAFKVHLRLAEYIDGKLEHFAICGCSSKEVTLDPRAVTCSKCKRYYIFTERKLEVTHLNF